MSVVVRRYGRPARHPPAPAGRPRRQESPVRTQVDAEPLDSSVKFTPTPTPSARSSCEEPGLDAAAAIEERAGSRYGAIFERRSPARETVMLLPFIEIGAHLPGEDQARVVVILHRMDLLGGLV